MFAFLLTNPAPLSVVAAGLFCLHGFSHVAWRVLTSSYVSSGGTAFTASDGARTAACVALVVVPVATAISLFSLLRAAVTPPGRAKESDSSMAALSNSFCRTCSHSRPPRSHHCNICGYCVLRRDHHCPWLGTCVGQCNGKFFAVGLIWSLSTCLTALAFWLPLAMGTWQPLRQVVVSAAKADRGRILAPVRPREPVADPAVAANAVFLLGALPTTSLAAFVLLATLCLTLTGLVSMQIYLLMTNRTMHELGGPAAHCRGSWRANVAEVLGPRMSTWLLPVAVPSVDVAKISVNITGIPAAESTL